MKYKTKSQVVEAFEYDPKRIPVGFNAKAIKELNVDKGQWIVRTIEGALVAMKREDFEKAYEPLNRATNSFEMSGNF